jgi:hypothetical protein
MPGRTGVKGPALLSESLLSVIWQPLQRSSPVPVWFGIPFAEMAEIFRSKQKIQAFPASAQGVRHD